MSPNKESLKLVRFELPSKTGLPVRPTSRRKVSNPIRIVVATEQALLRDGLRSYLHKQTGLKVVADTGTSDQVVSLVTQFRPDVLLLELSGAQLNGFGVLSKLNVGGLGTAVIALSDEFSKAQTLRAIQCGVRGFVLKNSSTSTLLQAIRHVFSGQYWIEHDNLLSLINAATNEPARNSSPQKKYGLTPREKEVIMAVLDGFTNPEIADKFGLSEQTVKHHLSHIFDKLGVYSRLELALFAVNHRLLEA